MVRGPNEGVQCHKGHPLWYGHANTYVRKNGTFMCRACHRERQRILHHAKRNGRRDQRVPKKRSE